MPGRDYGRVPGYILILWLLIWKGAAAGASAVCNMKTAAYL